MKSDLSADMQGHTAKWPIIIGGFYRSGTSLVRRMLNAHSRIHCGPEVKFFKDFYNDYFNDTLKHVRFFKTIRDLCVDDDVLLRSFGSAFIAIHDIAAQKQGKLRWADKSPENVIFINQWASLLKGKLYFIHCVRHPLDSLASLKEIGFSLTVPKAFDEKIRLFRTFVETGLDFEMKNSVISFRLRYEDLVTNPRSSLLKLMSFIHEEFEESMLDFNSMSHQDGLEDPKIRITKKIHLESLNRWNQVLTKEEVEAVTKNCPDLFEKLGYEMAKEPFGVG